MDDENAAHEEKAEQLIVARRGGVFPSLPRILDSPCFGVQTLDLP